MYKHAFNQNFYDTFNQILILQRFGFFVTGSVDWLNLRPFLPSFYLLFDDNADKME